MYERPPVAFYPQHEDTCPNHQAGGLQGHDLPGAVLSAPAPAAQVAFEWAGTVGVCMAASVTLGFDAIYVKLKC